MKISKQESDALCAWAEEAERGQEGLTGWGVLFDNAMKAAQSILKKRRGKALVGSNSKNKETIK